MKYIKLSNPSIAIYIPTYFSIEDINRYLRLQYLGLITDYLIDATQLEMSSGFGRHFIDFERNSYKLLFGQNLIDNVSI